MRNVLIVYVSILHEPFVDYPVFIWLKPEDCIVHTIRTKIHTRALSFLYGSGAVLIHVSVEDSVRRQPLS